MLIFSPWIRRRPSFAAGWISRHPNGESALVKSIVANGLHGYASGMTLNNCSSALALLETRRSGKPRDLVPPGPSDAELERILNIAARTPDHGKLSPWRFVIVDRTQRQALADLLSRALPENDPQATAAHYAKALEFAHQAPVMLVLVSAPIRDHKIPVWEQELSCGAVAMNLLHAANALGYVGGWITGWQAYNERVRSAFCADGERIAGFIFLGTPANPLEERPRPLLDDLVRQWQPPEND
jgi:nitroreductase